MKKVFVSMILAMFAAIGLTACGETNMVSIDRANEMAAKARNDEASKTDGKLANARSEVSMVGSKTARQGGFSAEANCNVIPADVGKTQAAKDFPSQVSSLYREACVKEVAKMNAERKANNDRAIARAKERERKLALQKRIDDAKIARARKVHPSTVQPIKSPAPVKPAAARQNERQT